MDEVNRYWNAFERYKETAEQHEFRLLMALDIRLMPAYIDLKKNYTEEHAKLFIKAMQKVCARLGIEPEVTA